MKKLTETDTFHLQRLYWDKNKEPVQEIRDGLGKEIGGYLYCLYVHDLIDYEQFRALYLVARKTI